MRCNGNLVIAVSDLLESYPSRLGMKTMQPFPNNKLFQKGNSLIIERNNMNIRGFRQGSEATDFFLERHKGQTLGEYVLILMLVVIVSVVVLGLFGNQVTALFQSVVATF